MILVLLKGKSNDALVAQLTAFSDQAHASFAPDLTLDEYLRRAYLVRDGILEYARKKEEEVLMALWVLYFDAFRKNLPSDFTFKYMSLNDFQREYSQIEGSEGDFAADSELEWRQSFEFANFMAVFRPFIVSNDHKIKVSKDLAIAVIKKLVQGAGSEFIRGGKMTRENRRCSFIFRHECGVKKRRTCKLPTGSISPVKKPAAATGRKRCVDEEEEGVDGLQSKVSRGDAFNDEKERKKDGYDGFLAIQSLEQLALFTLQVQRSPDLDGGAKWSLLLKTTQLSVSFACRNIEMDSLSNKIVGGEIAYDEAIQQMVDFDCELESLNSSGQLRRETEMETWLMVCLHLRGIPPKIFSVKETF